MTLTNQVLRLLLFNAILAVPFSVLWVKEYQMDPDLCHRLDKIMPWIWMGSFYLATLSALLRRPVLRILAVAVFYAGICWVIFFYFIVQLFLVPMFDPWF